MLPTLSRSYRALAQGLVSRFANRDIALEFKHPARNRQSRRNFALIEPLEERALMSTYYVSPTGSDNSAGTSASSPWKSISKVNSVTLHGGDSVLFQGGQTFYGSLSIGSKDSGSSSSEVTFGSYDGQATINSGKATGATVLNASGIWFEDLKFVGTPGSAPQSGINFEGYSQGVYYSNDRVDDCSISGYWTAGVLIEGCYTNGGFTGLRVTNSSIYNNVEAGIQSCATTGDTAILNLYIAHNQVYNNYGDGYSACTGNGIMLGNTTGALVEYNNAYLNGSSGGSGAVGIWAYTSNDVTFQYNQSYDNVSKRGRDGDGFDFDADVSNSVIQYNYAFGNDGTGIQLDQWENDSTFTNNIVRYNVLQDNARLNTYGNLEVWGKVLNSYLYNNTIYTTSSDSNSAIRVHNSTIPGLYVNGVHFLNNIIDSTGGATLINIPESEARGAVDLTFTGNVYWASGYTPTIVDGDNTYHSLAQWQSAGQETWAGAKYGVFADPEFAAANGGGTASVINSDTDLINAATAYNLKSTSPALTVKMNIDSMYGVTTGGRDFFGDSIASNATTVAGADQSAQTAGSFSTIATPSAPVTDISTLTGYDLGSVGSKGANSASSGTFTVTASGTDIGGTNDEFRYDEMSLTGDGTIIAEVTTLGDSNAGAKAGVMIRNVLSATSAEVSMLISPDAVASFETRAATSAGTTTKTASDSGDEWVKLVRSGSNFTGYISSDGINWTLVSSSTVAMNNTVLIGLAVTGHESSGTDTATFSNVNVS